MKLLKPYLQAMVFFFSLLILLHSCSVYKSAPVSIKEASKANAKVRVMTFDDQSLKFNSIEVVNNEVYGINKTNGERNATLIDKENIEKIQLKDKKTSTILTIVSLAAVTVGMFSFIVDRSLDNISPSF